MPSIIEVRRDGELLFAEGLICSQRIAVLHVRQDINPGEVWYLIDLNGTCDCGKRFSDHDGIGVAVGVVE